MCVTLELIMCVFFIVTFFRFWLLFSLKFIAELHFHRIMYFFSISHKANTPKSRFFFSSFFLQLSNQMTNMSPGKNIAQEKQNYKKFINPVFIDTKQFFFSISLNLSLS